MVAAPSPSTLAARRPRPGRRRSVRCLVCGIARGNSAGIPVLACRLAHCVRQGVSIRGTTLLTGLCVACLTEAIEDERLAGTAGARAMAGS